MREWTERHIRELIKNEIAKAGGGGGGSGGNQSCLYAELQHFDLGYEDIYGHPEKENVEDETSSDYNDADFTSYTLDVSTGTLERNYYNQVKFTNIGTITDSKTSNIIIPVPNGFDVSDWGDEGYVDFSLGLMSIDLTVNFDARRGTDTEWGGGLIDSCQMLVRPTVRYFKDSPNTVYIRFGVYVINPLTESLSANPPKIFFKSAVDMRDRVNKLSFPFYGKGKPGVAPYDGFIIAKVFRPELY